MSEERLGSLRPFPLLPLPGADTDEAELCVDGVCALPQDLAPEGEEDPPPAAGRPGTFSVGLRPLQPQSPSPKMTTVGEPSDPHNPDGLPDITATS